MNLLISLDGISCEDMYPMLDNFIEQGFSCVSNLETSFPSVTYTAHMNAITGEKPEKHHIFENVLLNKRSFERKELYDIGFDQTKEMIQAKTLFETIESQGLTSTAIHWPLAEGFSSVCINEKHYSHDELDGINEAIENDKRKKETVLDLIDQGQRDFVAVHFLQYDTIAHYYGVDHEKSKVARDTLLKYIWEMKEKIEAKGRCNMLIFSDHGLVNRKDTIYPNVFLSKNGFYDYIAFNRLRLVCDGSGSALYYSKLSHKEDIQVFKALKSSLKVKGIYMVRMSKGGTYAPKAIVDFTEGTCAEDILPGEEPKYTNLMGIHGHFEKNVNRMNGFLIAYGEKINRSRIISKGQISDIAKTVGKLMNIEHECNGGEISELFNETDSLDNSK